jgi:hypothetical protein
VTPSGGWATMAVAQDQLALSVTEDVAAAVVDVRRAFGEYLVHAWPDGSQGAYVVIDELNLGSFWKPATSWLGFIISYLHPDADCYPHHIRGDVLRADEKPLTAPFNANNNFAGITSVMISRSSPRRRKDADTPALKAVRLLEFLGHPE